MPLISTNFQKIDAPAATGNQTITVGFRATCAIYITSALTGGGFQANQAGGIGFTDFTTAFAISWGSEDNVATTNMAANGATGPVYVLNGSGTTIIGAAAQSLTATGYTLNWSTTLDGADVHALHIGGALAKVIQLQYGQTTTGNRAYTGIGFQPDFILQIHQSTATGINTAAVFPVGWGAATSSTARWATCINGQDGQTMTANINAERRQCTNRFLESFDAAGGLRQAADLVSMDTDGFTLNWIDAPTVSTDVFWVLALKGGVYTVNSFAKSASPTNSQSITTPGYRPKGLFLSSWNRVAGNQSTQITSSESLGLGSLVGASHGTIWSATVDAVINTQADAYNDTAAFNTSTNAATTNASGTTAGTSTGFDFTWNVNDADTDEILYWTIGDVPSIGESFDNPVTLRRPVPRLDWQWEYARFMAPPPPPSPPFIPFFPNDPVRLRWLYYDHTQVNLPLSTLFDLRPPIIPPQQPNPLIAGRLNPGFTQGFIPTEQAVPVVPIAWPNPTLRVSIPLDWIEGRIPPAVETFETRLPAITPIWWPSGAIARGFEPPNLLTTTLTVAGAPFVPIDWPTPRQAQRLIDWIQAAPRNLIDPLPFLNVDWPTPRRLPPRYDWIESTPYTLQAATVRPPFIAEWPNPLRTAGRPDWMAASPIALQQAAAGQPFSLTDWPNPGRLRPMPYDWALNTLVLAPIAVQPFKLTDWPNPQAARFPTELRTWLGILSYFGLDQFFGAPGQAPVYDTATPRGPAFPISLRTWIGDTTRFMGAPAALPPGQSLLTLPTLVLPFRTPFSFRRPVEVAGTPFTPIDWPNPLLRPPFPTPRTDREVIGDPFFPVWLDNPLTGDGRYAVARLLQIGSRLVLEVTALPPGANLTALPPTGQKLSAALLNWPQSYTILLPTEAPPPGAVLTPPNPRGPILMPPGFAAGSTIYIPVQPQLTGGVYIPIYRPRRRG